MVRLPTVKKFEKRPMFTRVDTVHEPVRRIDRQTDTETDVHLTTG